MLMKKISFYFSLLLFPVLAYTQDHADDLYLQKVKTLDATIENLYGVISGPAGEKRNWELFHYLFKPEAKLIPSGANKEGEIGCRYLSPEGYQESSGKWLEENGFFEKEIYRLTETFGNVTHVFSTYEAYRTQEDEAPFMRGINSIQLLHDGNRWWIINIYWTGETKDNVIPEKYLEKN